MRKPPPSQPPRFNEVRAVKPGNTMAERIGLGLRAYRFNEVRAVKPGNTAVKQELGLTSPEASMRSGR